MLKKIVHFVIKIRWVIIIFWVLAAGVVFFTAPNLSDVASGDQSSFLPADSETILSDNMTRELFKDKGGKSHLVLVLKREGGFTSEDENYAKNLEDYIDSNKDEFNALEVLSPFTNENLESELFNDEKTAALINISLTTANYTGAGTEAVLEMKDLIAGDSDTSHDGLAAKPEGLELYLTGDAAMSQEENENVNKSMDLTVKITIFLVILILVMIYRSPVAPILPLFTIGISFLISRGVIGYLTEMGLKVSTFTETFLVAVLFGAGTDYCLLIISRFKEERYSGKGVREALEDSIPGTGIAIVSSSFTVIVGFLFMIFAKFGLFNTTGPSVAVGVAITLIAVLTLTPALISVFGEKMFWPVKDLSGRRKSGKPSIWVGIANNITKKPGIYIIISLIIFLPFVFFSTRSYLSYDQLKEMPAGEQAVIGYEEMSESFSQGEMQPVKIVLKTDRNLWDAESLRDIDLIADNLMKVENVEKVRTASRPSGEKLTEISLPEQIGALTEGLDKVKEGFDPVKDGLADMKEGIDKISEGILSGSSDIGKLADATGKTADGIKEAINGIGDLSQGTADASGGISKVSGGLASLADGLTQSEGALAQTGTALSGSVTAIEQIMANNAALAADQNFQTLYYSIKAASEGITQISGGIGQIKANLQTSKGALDNINGGLGQIEGGLGSTKEGMNQIRQGLVQMQEGQEKAGEGLKTASESLDKVSEGFNPLNEGLDEMNSGLGEISDASGTYSNNEDILDDVFFLPETILAEAPELKDAMKNYISENGNGLIIEVILSVPPYTNQALDTVEKIDEAVAFSIKGTSLEDAQYHMGGGTTALSEVRDITSRDMKVVMIFVLSGIFLVLIALLKSLVAPVYLIITILFSYLSTMGITYLVFQKLLGYDGLHWSVPFFSFCVLVALGVDYNIFLMSRVKEEYRPGDNKGSITRALASTGGIITSCGIIMAGTFGAMLASPVLPILEVGFAAVVGLLLDTFIIRCFTVPAIAVKFGELNWWPGKRIKVISLEKPVVKKDEDREDFNE